MAKKLSEEEIKSIAPKTLLKMIDLLKKTIKKDPVIIKLFKDYEIDLNELDLVPMAFADIPVSARTAHGCIYFSYKLLEDGDFSKDYSYATHELTHWAQQTALSKPTQGADDGDYLSNPYEQEGFQNQVEYIANHNGEQKAEKYVDKVLDHHDKKGKEKIKLREKLLSKI